MFPFGSNNKKAALLIVLLLLLPVILLALWMGPSLMEQDNKIDLSPLSAESGKITSFTVKTEGDGGTVHLPNTTLAVIDERLSQDRN